jgi:hypothetical protein
MADKTTSITITAAPRKKQQQGKRGKEVRHGAFTRIEDDPLVVAAAPKIVLLNCGMTLDYRFAGDFFQSFCYIQHGFSTDLTFAGPMGYADFPARLDLTDAADVATWATRMRAYCFLRTNFNYDPDTFAGPLHDYNMAVPFADATLAGVSVKVGSTSFPLSGAPWTVKPTATDAHEIAESSLTADVQVCPAGPPDSFSAKWYPFQREAWRDYGILKPKKNGLLAVESSGIYFEPFDMADTTNYKVVRAVNDDTTPGAFDSTEVVPEQLKKGLCRVYLVPQLWKFVITYTRHRDASWVEIYGGEHVAAYHRYYHGDPVVDTGYAPGLAGPQPRGGWATTPGTTRFSDAPARLLSALSTPWNPTDTSEANLLRLMMWVSYYHKITEGVNPQAGSGETVPATPTATHVPPGTITGGGGGDEVCRADASVVVTQEGAPVGLLVGVVEFAAADAHRYLIFRKTARVVESVAIYSGAYDDPPYKNTFHTSSGTVPDDLCTSQSMSFTDDTTAKSHTYPSVRWAWDTAALPCSGAWDYAYPLRLLG